MLNNKEFKREKPIENIKKEDEMEEIHKKDYKALKEYANFTRAELEVQKQKKTYEIELEQEKRLINLGYISWDKDSKELYRPEFILTIKGNEEFLKLKAEYVKDYKFWIAIIALIVSLLKNFGVF